MLGIYCHIPFCAVKCPYCDFYSLPARPAAMDAFLAALLSEISALPEGLTADTVYFGGGTPVLFGAERLGKVLSALRSRLTLSPDAEVTLEANPFSTPEREYAALRAAGFNRISFGIQSAVPEELKQLGRLQGPEQVRTAVSRARAAGFTNLSGDLMLGVPLQTKDTLKTSVDFLASLGLEHVSAYLLKVEEDTPFAENGVLSRCPDEEEQAELYLEAVRLLEEHGFFQYEISNFARPGFQSRHNKKYWQREEYLGLGPAAHGFFDGKRVAHPRDLDGYIASGGGDLFVTDEVPDPLEEELMLRLRLTEGVDLAALSLPDGGKERIKKAMHPLEKGGLVRLCGERLSLTPEGFLVSNEIITMCIRSASAVNS